jgi:hypothetical protein
LLSNVPSLIQGGNRVRVLNIPELGRPSSPTTVTQSTVIRISNINQSQSYHIPIFDYLSPKDKVTKENLSVEPRICNIWRVKLMRVEPKKI